MNSYRASTAAIFMSKESPIPHKPLACIAMAVDFLQDILASGSKDAKC